MIAESTTRVVDAQALWTHQLAGKTVVNALTSLFATESQALETVVQDALLARSIDGAAGQQLDDLGLLVGQLREGRDDERYRVWIKARIRANRSSGSPPDMYAVAHLILGSATPLWLRQFPVGHALQVGQYVDVNPYDAQRILQQTSPVAVPFFYWYQEDVPYVFKFSDTSSITAASNYGFNGGRLRGSIGPDSEEPDYQAVWQAILGDAFVAAFDAREIIPSTLDWYSNANLFEAGAGTPTLAPNAHKDWIPELQLPLPSTMTSTSQPLFDVFEGAPAFTVAWYGSSGGALSYVLSLEDDLADNLVYIRVQTGTVRLILSDGTSSTFTGSALADTNDHTFVVTYDGAGSADFWLDGVKTTGAATHRPAAGLTTLRLGATASAGFSVPFIAFATGVATDEQIALLEAQMLREFTDTYT